MAHNVEKMFSVRKRPWHYDETGKDGRAVVVDHDVTTWEEARVLAGLEWDPIEETPYRQVLSMSENGEPTETFEPVPGFKWITRSDTHEVLDNASDSYSLITNSDMGDIVGAFMDGHKIVYETGGCLEGGRKTWVLLQAPGYLEIPGDPSPIARYIALLNAHDGHGSCRAIATDIRVVCSNTWHLADTISDSKERGRATTAFSFHHRAQWRQHLDQLRADVQAALTGAKVQQDAFAEFAETMAMRTVTAEQSRRFIDEWVFPTRDEYKLKPKALENVTEVRDRVTYILGSETCEGIRGTAWGLIQAAGEYLDHDRKYLNGDTMLGRTVFTADERKARAVRMADLAASGSL